MAKYAKTGGTAVVAVALLVIIVSSKVAKCAEPMQALKVSFDVNGVVASPDGNFVAVLKKQVSNDNPLLIWNRKRGKFVVELRDKKEPFGNTSAAAFSPDGKLLAATTGAGSIGFIRIWDTRTWRIVRRFRALESQHGAALAFSPDGRTLVASHACEMELIPHRATIDFWNVKTGKLEANFGVDRMCHKIVFSNDGRYVACNSSQKVHICNTRLLTRLSVSSSREQHAFRLLGFSPGGKSLLVNEEDGLRIFDVSTGQENVWMRLGQDVVAVSYLPARQRIVVATEVDSVFSVNLFDHKLRRNVAAVIRDASPDPNADSLLIVPHGYFGPILTSLERDGSLCLLRRNVISFWDIKKSTTDIKK